MSTWKASCLSSSAISSSQRLLFVLYLSYVHVATPYSHSNTGNSVIWLLLLQSLLFTWSTTSIVPVSNFIKIPLFSSKPPECSCLYFPCYFYNNHTKALSSIACLCFDYTCEENFSSRGRGTFLCILEPVTHQSGRLALRVPSQVTRSQGASLADLSSCPVLLLSLKAFARLTCPSQSSNSLIFPSFSD